MKKWKNEKMKKFHQTEKVLCKLKEVESKDFQRKKW